MTEPALPMLFDPARHEALQDGTWSEAAARAAIVRIAASAEAAFDTAHGGWDLHPLDDPPAPGARSSNLYWGATGVLWALRHLAAVGAVSLCRDYRPWIAALPERVRDEARDEAHGSASYLFGESAAQLLAWQIDRDPARAERLRALVQGNRHNPAHEPLWGNAGTVLAAIHAAESDPDPRWRDLVQQAVQALLDDMVVDPETGTWIWEQDLYGRRSRHLGAGHGLAGNAYAAVRAAALTDGFAAQTVIARAVETLTCTALRMDGEATDDQALVNWHPLVDRDRVAAWVAKGGRPLVQDCHGAPGIVCRLAGVPGDSHWDALLRAAGALIWKAGPLVKGPSVCHGTAGSALACLKLWRRFGDPTWLDRARWLALHAAEQTEQARARHGQGRHSLWTGDLGVACVLWSCVQGDDRFPTLDHF